MVSAKQIKASKKKTALKAKRKKKKWFKVLSPKFYGEKEIGDITAFEPNDLLGRTIELSMRFLSPSSRNLNEKVVLRINKVKGETAETEVARYFLTDNSIQKKSRKIKEKITSVFVIKHAGKNVKFKLLVTTTNHLPRSTKTTIAKALPELVLSKVKKKSLEDFFTPGFNAKLSLELKKSLKFIYPVSTVHIWKLSIIE